MIRGGRPVLDDLSFEIREGEHTAILGPNGCGKSSLIRLVNKQDHPLHRQNGESPIRILGKDRWDLFELRSQLGIVSADLRQAFIGATGGGRRNGREVVLLKEGRVFLDGSKKEVLTATHLSGLYGAKVRLEQNGGYHTAFCDQG